MSSDAPSNRTSKRRVGLAAGVAFLLLCSYLLSVGPFARLNRSGYIPLWAANIAEVVYAPLLWIADHTAFSHPFRWYLELWLPEDIAKT
jgi:hypothetical protein